MTRAPTVYFYCGNERGNLQEDVIAIAEGLVELGIPFYANCDYWRQSVRPDDFLFKHDPSISPEDCDIVVVSYTWPYWVRMGTFDLIQKPLPECIHRKNRPFATVFMDNHDGYRTVSWDSQYRSFDLILRSKLNRRAWHPTNMRPWAYGLTKRVMRATDGGLPFVERQRRLVVNFGASHPFFHGARDLARRRLELKIEEILPVDRTKDDLSCEPLDPYGSLMWRQTGGRFNYGFYERLKRSQAVACFCGDIVPSMPFRSLDRYMVGGNRAKLLPAAYEILGMFDPRPPRAVGWDSFRFWEALSAGSAAVNIDLDHYGVDLPIMPVNGVDYLGVNLSRVNDFLDLLREPSVLERVGIAGKKWAEKHYAPKPVAERFLKLVGSEAYNRSSTEPVSPYL